MLTNDRSPTIIRALVVLAAVAFSGAASAIPYAIGDVFASTGNGEVKVFSQTGVLKQTLNTGLGGFTTGSTFDAAGNFYVTAFSANQISKFDNNGVLVDATWTTGATLSAPESIVFDAAGNAYIGNAQAARINKVSGAGVQLANFATLQNTDWIDLAADQTTLLYSNEGNVIRELDTATNVDTVFATGTGPFFAKRYLADGGVLVASGSGNVYRYDSAGVLQQTYASGIGGVFALNLDPNGTSFWTGSTGGTSVRKFNLATGVVEQSWSTGGGQLFGLAVFGEIQAGGGGGGGGGTQVPEPGILSLFGLGLAALGSIRRRRNTPSA